MWLSVVCAHTGIDGETVTMQWLSSGDVVPMRSRFGQLDYWRLQFANALELIMSTQSISSQFGGVFVGAEAAMAVMAVMAVMAALAQVLNHIRPNCQLSQHNYQSTDAVKHL